MKIGRDAAARRRLVERLYEQHGPGLLAYASSVLGERAAAEDVLHQLFLKLLAGRVSIDGEPLAYLYRAVRNASLNAQRSAARLVELGSRDVWFEAAPLMRDEALGLQTALVEIPQEQREVIVLRIWGGMTLQEASALLDIPLNTAASRYRYGLAKLRERMNPLGGK